MLCLEDINPNWRDTPPTATNLTKEKTMEWGLLEELSRVENQLKQLVERTTAMKEMYSTGIANGSFSEWVTVCETLGEWSDNLESEMEEIIQSFY